MSGHSKWATIKHKKAAVDKARGKLWAKLVRNIEIAAREGGGDVNANATLRTMVQKAKAEQVPNDKIENAIKRGTGELKAENVENITYEGYAPCGVAVLVEVTTDNRNRSGAEVRTLFSRNGGSMAEPGAVGWQFERKGVITVTKHRKGSAAVSEDDLMLAALDAGLEDIVDNGDTWEVRCTPSAVGAVCDALGEAGIVFDSADRPMVATTAVPLTTADEAKRVLKLVEALEDHDDVDEVYANFDISDEIFAALDA